jgi:hypothetical protein
MQFRAWFPTFLTARSDFERGTVISIFDRALRFRTRNSHSDFNFGETFRRAKEEFIISCGTAYEFEASQKSFCDVSTVETFFEHPDDLLLSCVSWVQAICEIEVFEPLLITFPI